ncbi:hypothetical protein L195_g011816 [Trifolium pratense]|uniref:Uncharacterized protein n=1 Tax=Trifolium pratense TaxID=57577 RepID=A0A2K3PIK6_TRIPR|nr:hypothetical protein L195_g011816 [Trifolium pratense]
MVVSCPVPVGNPLPSSLASYGLSFRHLLKERSVTTYKTSLYSICILIGCSCRVWWPGFSLASPKSIISIRPARDASLS